VLAHPGSLGQNPRGKTVACVCVRVRVRVCIRACVHACSLEAGDFESAQTDFDFTTVLSSYVTLAHPK